MFAHSRFVAAYLCSLLSNTACKNVLHSTHSINFEMPKAKTDGRKNLSGLALRTAGASYLLQ